MGGGISHLSDSKKKDMELSKSEVMAIVTEDEFREVEWNIIQNGDGKVTVGQLLNFLEEEVKTRAQMDAEFKNAIDSASITVDSADLGASVTVDSVDLDSDDDNDNSPQLSIELIVDLRRKVKQLSRHTSHHKMRAAVAIKNKLKQLLGMDQQQSSSKLVPRDIFRRIDTSGNGDGTITIDEWAICLRRRLGLTEDEVIRDDLSLIFEDINVKDDGKISMMEFCAWWHSINSSASTRHPADGEFPSHSTCDHGESSVDGLGLDLKTQGT